MNLNYEIDPDGSLVFTGRVASTELLSERIAIAIARDIVAQVVDRVVAEKGAKIIARIDMKAIANLVMAEAVNQIARRITIEPSSSQG